MPLDQLRTKGEKVDKIEQDICLFAETNYRNQMRRFGIKTDDRRRHMYIIGKTGMGKTTMMENMVFHDIYAGHGVGIVDPHGDFAEKIIDYIPPNRINDVVYFNPADLDYPIGFNILEVRSAEQRHLVAAGLMGIFKKIWPDVWSSRMEYILNNTILGLLDYPGSTLLGINRLLADKAYRRRVIRKLKDPVVKAFWQNEFASYSEKYAQEAVAPIQNKIGQFLSASVIRNMVAQVKSTINVREIMDGQKIFVMNLSKGRIGEDNSRLLGGMLITELQLAAMERVDTPEADRKDFFLYVDEFQNFATPSFANILSEARKYRLSLIMAHQYITQLDELVANAVFGNVGTIVTFRVGGADAEVLAKEYTPTFLEEDIVNLAKFDIFLKLMIDGVASQPFSACTMAPIGTPTGSRDKVVRVSRERYARHRTTIEDKIMRWSGMEPGLGEGTDDMDDEEMDDDEREEKSKIDKPMVNQQSPAMPKIQSVSASPVLLPPGLPKQDVPSTPTVSLKSLLPRGPSLPPPDRVLPGPALVAHGAPGPLVEGEQTRKRKRRRKNKMSASPTTIPTWSPTVTTSPPPLPPSLRVTPSTSPAPSVGNTVSLPAAPKVPDVPPQKLSPDEMIHFDA
ncbi:MAG: type IV secretion system DNA-binding domain-containing protein [Candidatus Magasanikbacteria bacterium]|nr:type IV secretion system DNA-binding domain-containing protein [Candidatus Magasanikbacteria bacterium]